MINLGIFSSLRFLFGGTTKEKNQQPTTSTSPKNIEATKLHTYSLISSTPSDYTVIDFETTGLTAGQDEIIQLSAVKYRQDVVVNQMVSYVNPKCSIPAKITKLTGIRTSDVKSAPTLEEILPVFLNFIEEDILVIHNASFDMNFLMASCNKLNISPRHFQVIDTVQLARTFIKDSENHKLETLKNYLNLSYSSHDALDDCLVCGAVYRYCKKIKEEKTAKKQEKLATRDPISEEEQSFFVWVKELLEKENLDTSLLKLGRTGSYTDIKYFYTFIRFKPNGKKHYLLSRKTIKEIKKLYPDASCSDATSGEIGETRIYFSTIEELKKYEKVYLESYKNTRESLDYFRKDYKNAQYEIEKYMSM